MLIALCGSMPTERPSQKLFAPKWAQNSSEGSWRRRRVGGGEVEKGWGGVSKPKAVRTRGKAKQDRQTAREEGRERESTRARERKRCLSVLNFVTWAVPTTLDTRFVVIGTQFTDISFTNYAFKYKKKLRLQVHNLTQFCDIQYQQFCCIQFSDINIQVAVCTSLSRDIQSIFLFFASQ